MQFSFAKRIIVAGFIIAVLGIGAFAIFAMRKKEPAPIVVQPAEEVKRSGPQHEVLGVSVEGRTIDAYTYGSGKTRLMFVGGIHGGYEWNSVLLAYQAMDYLAGNPDAIPSNLSVTIIPSANPDGVYKVIGKDGRFAISDIPAKKQILGTGRFNANGVDLNRNFDCNWKPESTWQSKKVSAGTAAFSEPEAKAIQGFVLKEKPAAGIFWHSQSNAVYASECNAGILSKTLDVMNVYSKAAGYPAVKSFTAYSISGDAEGWLASIGTPAITVELKTHTTVEWQQNLEGIKALLEYFRAKS